MFWLRAILFSSPLLLVFGGSWLFDRVSELQLSSETDALVYAIQEPVGMLNPLVPSSGITGEVTDLIFEPLLARDEKLKLVPNLIENWSFQTLMTIRCSSEEAAGESEAMLRSGEYLKEGMELLALDRSESVLTLALRGIESGLDTRLLGGFAAENLGDYLLVKLTLKHSVRDSVESFLKGAVEKTQIRMIDYVGDREANLFVRGETDLFLRELKLYYESNRSLEADVEVVGEQCHTTTREMLMDLRADVKWHDGRPFTAGDVLSSYTQLTQPDSLLPLAASFWFVERIEMVGPHRIRIECKDALAAMLESWEKLPVFPSHLLPVIASDKARDAFFANPVGTGPYRFAGRRSDGGVELLANEEHFREVPLEKRVRYRRFGSLESTLLALRSSSLDAIVPDDRFTDWSERNPGMVEAIRCLPRFQHFVAWNLDRDFLDRKPVRGALARAIDLKQVLRDSATVFEEPVKGLFFPGVPYCDEPILLPLYDPRGAERVLEAEGFRLNEKTGIRSGADGKELSFTLSVNQANAEHRRMAESLAEQWGGIGVKVELKFESWNDLVGNRLLTREFDAVLLSWEIPLERDRYAVWHSSGVGPGGGNFSGLRNQTVDQLLEKIRYETDESIVKSHTSRLQKEIADLQPCFFVCESGRILTVRTGGMAVRRPSSVGQERSEPLTGGNVGLEQVRPWWVREDTGTSLKSKEPESE